MTEETNITKTDVPAVVPPTKPEEEKPTYIKPRVGRPLKYKPDELAKKIDDYFMSCTREEWVDEVMRDDDGNIQYNAYGVKLYKPIRVRKQHKPITVGGLAVYLDTSRETLREYKDRPEFVDTIKRAWDYIEMSLENGMLDGSINPTAGIFNAKNNFGWRDKTETDITSKGKSIASKSTTFIIKDFSKPKEEITTTPKGTGNGTGNTADNSQSVPASANPVA